MIMKSGFILCSIKKNGNSGFELANFLAYIVLAPKFEFMN